MKVIASHNGVEATRLAYSLITSGRSALDACIEGVTLVENDPDECTVGYGGLPNEDGIVELDAAVMDGRTHCVGAVAALRDYRNPTKVARLVMDYTDHVLLVGEGAARLAAAHGFVQENLLTEKARKIWLHWKQTLSPHDDWLPPPEGSVDPEAAAYFERYDRPTGTVHCAAIDSRGDLACVTSTSGLAFKIAGRVGDSPIAGAGLYTDNEVGSCGSIGRGEANLENVSSFAVVELMRHGRSPQEAGLEVLRRMSHRTVGRLCDKQGRPNFNLQLFALSRDGQYAGVAMRGPKQFAITDEHGTRLEDCVSLYEIGK